MGPTYLHNYTSFEFQVISDEPGEHIIIFGVEFNGVTAVMHFTLVIKEKKSDYICDYQGLSVNINNLFKNHS